MLNLTQHECTTEQMAEGAYEPSPSGKATLKLLLTFTGEGIRSGLIPQRARQISEIAAREAGENKQVFIGGLPALMGPLTEALRAQGLEVFFAHSDRVSEDQVQPDGSVKKIAVFKHQFFYPAH